MEILISGASTGIGRASAIHMARLGHSVWAGVRSEKAFQDVIKMNVQGLKPVYLDVTDEDSIEKCVSRIKKEAGLIHALVNNAGIVIAGPAEAVSMEDWRRQFDVNLFGTIALCKATLPLLRECKGRIVNISSIAGRVSAPLMSPYSASKFALEAFSDGLRREVAEHGVKVAIVEPGPIDTPIWDKSLEANLISADDYPEDLKELYRPMINRFHKRVKEAPERSSPVSVVVEAIAHALTSSRPRIRYPVGRGVQMMMWAAKAVPDGLLDRVVSRI